MEDQLIPQAEERSSNPYCCFYSAAEPESASPSRADLFMFPCPHCSHRALRWHSTIPWTKRAGKLYCITEHLGLLPKRSLKEKKWFDKSKVVNPQSVLCRVLHKKVIKQGYQNFSTKSGNIYPLSQHFGGF